MTFVDEQTCIWTAGEEGAVHRQHKALQLCLGHKLGRMLCRASRLLVFFKTLTLNCYSSAQKYISVNWNASGGGAFAILPLPSPFEAHKLPSKLPDVIPLARGHTAPVLDTDWSPHDDTLVASAGDDGQLLLWKVDASTAEAFEDWGKDKWVPPPDFEPVMRIGASSRRVGQVLWHPTARHVVAGTTGDHVVKLWDVNHPEAPQRTLAGGHADAIQSMCFDSSGNLVATTCRDRKLRVFDARSSSGDPVRLAEAHGGIKGARVCWLGSHDRLATTGFSRMSDRQIALWDVGSLANVKMLSVDQSSGVLMPFWSENGILFVAGKGDGNVRYYEYEHDNLHPLAEHSSANPQRGMCFLPRRSLDVAECEIARAYRVAGSTIEPVAFVVPRKSDAFQADIYPPALSAEPALEADEFFAGKTAPPKLVSLESGAVSASEAPFTPVTAPPPISRTASKANVNVNVPVQAPAIAKTSSAPLPEPARKASEPEPVPVPALTLAPTPAPTLAPSFSKLSEAPASDAGESVSRALSFFLILNPFCSRVVSINL